MATRIQEILTNLQRQVHACKQLKEDTETASWNEARGVILSTDDAEFLVSCFESINPTQL